MAPALMSAPEMPTISDRKPASCCSNAARLSGVYALRAVTTSSSRSGGEISFMPAAVHCLMSSRLPPASRQVFAATASSCS